MQSHANVVTASGGGCGDSSWDHHDDGGSKDVTWADQQTGGMPFGGSDRVGAAPTQVGVCGDAYGDNDTGSSGWTEESDPWSSGSGPQLAGVQQESSDEERDDGATAGAAGSGRGAWWWLAFLYYWELGAVHRPVFYRRPFVCATVRVDCCLPPPITCYPRFYPTAPPARLSGLEIARFPYMELAPASS